MGSESRTDKLPLIEKTVKMISKCQLLFALNNSFNLLILFLFHCY